MSQMKVSIVFLWKRFICIVFNRHTWNELTLIRWCSKCLLEAKDPEGDWITLGDDYDSDWMTPTQMKTYSDELLQYLDSHTPGG